MGKKANGLSIFSGALFAYIVHFAVLAPQKSSALGCKKDASCTCEDTFWNNDCKPWDMVVTNDCFCALLNWFATIVFMNILPNWDPAHGTMPACLSWDAPSSDVLAKFGKIPLTYETREKITSKRVTPTNSIGYLFLLAAWMISILSMPWMTMFGGETKGDKYIAPMPGWFFMGFPSYMWGQIIGNVFAMCLGFVAITYYWEASDQDVSGMPPLRKVMTQMDMEDVAEWIGELATKHNGPPQSPLPPRSSASSYAVGTSTDWLYACARLSAWSLFDRSAYRRSCHRVRWAVHGARDDRQSVGHRHGR